MVPGATALREANTADLPTLLALVHGAFEEYRGRLDPPSGAHDETLESLGRELRTGGALLAFVDGQPAGCVFYDPRQITSTWDGCRCYPRTGAAASAVC